ncbi:MAG TPA: hypothetical protein ENK75_00145 [Saprospiraceae bacterium]|nr:hypothetical protein [Saprospiraceae bacterium]
MNEETVERLKMNIEEKKENVLKKIYYETPSMISRQEQSDWNILMSYDNFSEPQDFGFDAKEEYKNLSTEELQEVARNMLAKSA